MISDKQKMILAFPYSDYDAIIMDGAIRSGKTSIGFLSFVDDIMRRYNGQMVIVAGKTVKSAVRNIIVPYKAMSYARKRYTINFRVSDNIMTVTRGSVTNYFHVFGGKDERSYELIQGCTAAGAFLDEVALMPRSFVEQALARCSVENSKLWFNCNPDSPKHWFYEEWIIGAAQKNALHVHFELSDNPSLSDKIISRYEAMYSGVFYDRYIRGLWVVAEGLVYQMPDEAITCTPDDALGDGRGAWYISMDYGITNPFAAILWRVTASRAYAVKEYVFDSRKENRRLTDEEHYANVERLAQYVDENGNTRTRNIECIVIDPSANSFKETIRRHGKFDYRNAKNDVISGISTTTTMLENGHVKISTDCKSLLVEKGLYRWDDKSDKDAVLKDNDHCLDAARYMCHTILRHELEGYV